MNKEEVVVALAKVRFALGMHMLELRYSDDAVDVANSLHLEEMVKELEECINKVKCHVKDDAEL